MKTDALFSELKFPLFMNIDPHAESAKKIKKDVYPTSERQAVAIRTYILCIIKNVIVLSHLL